jgi:hypothetical protein
MADCKLIAFLLCDKASVDVEGAVTLHAPAQGFVIHRPRMRNLGSAKHADTAFIFYRIITDQQCRIALKVRDPFEVEITGICRDFINPQEDSVHQGVWILGANLFEIQGRYVLELVQEVEGSPPRSLAATSLFVSRG